MHSTATTQEDLERNQLHAHYLERAKDLMADAARDGVVVNLNMHTANQKATFSSNNGVVVSAFSGKGKPLLYVENNAKGPYES